LSQTISNTGCLLPLTEKRDAVPQAQHVVNRYQCDKLVTDDHHEFVTLNIQVDSTWDNWHDNSYGWCPPVQVA